MKILITAILVCFVSLVVSIQPCLSWTEYSNIRYMDLDGDLASEIIIEAKYGAGSNHYIEDMRIFKDKNPELELIFTVRTLDSYFGLDAPNSYNIVSEVKFTEQTPENKGVRDIIVTSKKIYFKDKDNKVIDKEEDLGVKVFAMYGSSYTVNKVSRSVDLDNNGKKELVVAQQHYETISKDIPSIAMGEIITVSTSGSKEIASFSMPDHMGELEFMSLNNDGFEQIVAWSYGGAHYTNIAIYGYKDSVLYKIFENGSACGVETDFEAEKPLIKIGRANWDKKGWCYADEPLWAVYKWNGRKFTYVRELSTAQEISENEEVNKFVDRVKEGINKKDE